MILIESLYGNIKIGNKVALVGNIAAGEKIELRGKIICGGSRDFPKYHGEYVVIPKTYAQYLDTDNKIMEDDVTVTEIPYAEVGNIYGVTVTIAN